MEYRTLPHGSERISVIGLGSGSLSGSEAEMIEVLTTAMHHGINYFDMAPSEKAPFFAYKKAFSGRRNDVFIQMHFGAVYKNGAYGWTRKLDDIKEQFAWQLELLDTDYTDMGFIHCMDDFEDFQHVMKDGLWDYMKKLKRQGTIRHLGFSSHNPQIAYRMLETGLVDMMMFSINPSYDYRKGDYALGEVEQRAALYRECERRGVGISVMKPFAGGQLLDAKRSLFDHALTHVQCMQYVLDRPGVLTVLPGVRSIDDLRTVLHYEAATKEEKDYSVIAGISPRAAKGICVYCNHCQPCPAGLNIGLINKYYDLALAGDLMAKGHYDKLPLHAEACMKCGHCEARCPFHVRQEVRMEQIAKYFK